jgi:hypothetical protein
MVFVDRLFGGDLSPQLRGNSYDGDFPRLPRNHHGCNSTHSGIVVRQQWKSGVFEVTSPVARPSVSRVD